MPRPSVQLLDGPPVVRKDAVRPPLMVDTNNPTPALGLYLSVGMNPVLVFDGWRRVPVA